MKYYKVLKDNQSCSSGSFDWTPYLPHDDHPGEWTPVINNLEVCSTGYHGTDADHIVGFIHGNQLFEVEALDPEWHEDKDKFVCKSMRLVRKIDTWNDKTLRLFACWCVRQFWELLTDERSRNAVEVAEKFANGEATSEELVAARDAAWDAAGDAAGDAARDAAWSAAWDAAGEAAWDAAGAAGAAAGDAAGDAARDAAWSAAWDAQSKHLVEMLGI
jgi:hypothetical protein